jgi:polyisoprenyl-phosphate glycosyltransferase
MVSIKIKYSLILPIYNNALFIPELITDINDLQSSLTDQLEAIFVIDGSPDDSLIVLKRHLFNLHVPVKIINLSKNFGSFLAIKAGIDHARGQFIAIKAADRQEPMSLVRRFFTALIKDEADIVIGARKSRRDPLNHRLSANFFWFIYRKLVNSQIPAGGVDMFACNQNVIPYIKAMSETHSSLIEYLFWLGFRRKVVYYNRLRRIQGHGGWTLSKKIKLASDSVFSFSDLPIRFFYALGIISSTLAILLALIVIISKLIGSIQVPGYAAIVVISLFFFGLNAIGLSILGSYVWRSYENTKSRPSYIIQDTHDYHPE